MAITNYAIIDRVGSVSANIKDVNKRIYTKAEKDGFKDKVYEMKKICLADSPYAREVTDKMKWRARHTKNPERVYFVCPELNSFSERELKKWYDRCIEVWVFEADHNFIYKYETVYDTHRYTFHDDKASVLDRIVEMYGPALGYNFEAPVTRIDNVLVPDNYCKRPDHDSITASGETHFTKPFTRKERFFEYNCTLIPEKQKKECLQKLAYLLKLTDCTIDLTLGATFGALTGNTKLFSTFLEIDYTICKACGRPRNIRNHKDKYGNTSLNSICPHCETEFSEDTLNPSTYYEDSYRDEYEDNPYMDYESTLISPDFFPEEFVDELISQF